MSTELITPENLSTKLLKSVFDAAYMEVSVDNDGDIRVQEDVNCIVLFSESDKELIKLLTIFGFKSTSSDADRLHAANNINNEYKIIKAVAGNNDSLVFQWDIPIAGGITKKSLVLAVKRFCDIPRVAIQEHAADLVE